MNKDNQPLCEGEIIARDMHAESVPTTVAITEEMPLCDAELLALENSQKREKPAIKTLKKFFKRYFIDAFTGMAQGLFVTLIAGTILCQIASWIGLDNGFGQMLNTVGTLAKILMGAGIGVGIAHFWKCPKLVVFAAAVTGFVGAWADYVLVGNIAAGTLAARFPLVFQLGLPGNPIGSYIVSVLTIEIASKFVAGRTKLDIILVPLAMFLVSVGAVYVAWPFIKLVNLIGEGIGLATSAAPVTMGIIISVSMGLLLTLPTSSAAIWVAIATATASSTAIAGGNADANMLLAGGAAVVGCASHMVGFAVASFRENKWSGLISQGIGTSMLQIPNLMKRPRILLPAVLASAIVGPLATTVLPLYCTSTGGGMGTSGLVGVFGAIEASTYMGMSSAQIGVNIALLMFVLPAIIAFATSELMRRFKLIKFGDMLLSA